MQWFRQFGKRFGALPTWTKWTIGVIGTLLVGAVENAIGNFIDSGSVAGFEALIGHDVSINLLVLLFLVTAPALIVVLFTWASMRSQRISRNNFQWQYARAAELEIVYDKLINLVTSLVRVTDQTALDEAMERLLEEYLIGCANIVPSKHVLRATIVRLDKASGLLVPWSHLRMPAESLKRIRWKLEPKRDRSVAAESYQDGLVRLARFVNGSNHEPEIWHAHNGLWVPDRAKYLEYEEERGTRLRYESFVALPISKRGASALALVCLDSRELDTFTDSRIIDLLDRMRQFLVPAIQLYNDLLSAIVAAANASVPTQEEGESAPAIPATVNDPPTAATPVATAPSAHQQPAPTGGSGARSGPASGSVSGSASGSVPPNLRQTRRRHKSRR